MKACVSIILLSFLTTFSAHAFDGKRKGFTAGIGGIYAPYVRTTNVTPGIHQTESGPGLELLAGWGLSDHDLLAYYMGISFQVTGDTLRELASLGFEGVCWYHYYGQSGRSLYSFAGLGLTLFNGNIRDGDRRGPGLLFGVGVEFPKQIQTGLNMMVGRTSRDGTASAHFMLLFSVSLIAY